MVEVLTKETLRRMMDSKASPQKQYYPIHPEMWGRFLELGYTEKQLTDYGFLKSDYIEPLIKEA